jgi:hypothetical protein
MDVWGWIVVYAVGLTVFQLLLYRYFVQQGTPLDRGTGFDGDDGAERDSGVERAVDPHIHLLLNPTEGEPFNEGVTEVNPETPGGRTCPRCGAKNESDTAFTRCWSCTGRL